MTVSLPYAVCHITFAVGVEIVHQIWLDDIEKCIYTLLVIF